jgi:hypothetical protein
MKENIKHECLYPTVRPIIIPTPATVLYANISEMFIVSILYQLFISIYKHPHLYAIAVHFRDVPPCAANPIVDLQGHTI